MTVSDEAGVPVLRARGVRVEVPGARSRVLRRRAAASRVVDGLDVGVWAGDLVWLVGAPGEGAKEAGQVLAGEIPTISGVVELNGRALPTPRARRRTRSQRQLVWLDADAGVTVDSKRTALEIVAEAAAGSARSVSPEHVARAGDVLARLGLSPDSWQARAASLSASDARLVTAACALAPRPRAVVYHPSSRIDMEGDPVWAALTELREESSTALVVVAGGMPGALDPRSRVLVLCGGRVVEVLGHGDLSHPLHPYTLTLGDRPLRSPSGAATAGSRPPAGNADEMCPFRGDCPKAKPRCATEVPRLARPLGATHEVACHFPEDPRRPEGAAQAGVTGAGSRGGLASPMNPVVGSGASDEPTAREFAEG